MYSLTSPSSFINKKLEETGDKNLKDHLKEPSLESKNSNAKVKAENYSLLFLFFFKNIK